MPACSIVSVLIILMTAPVVPAPSDRYQAKKWFNLSLREKNPAKKIEALAKAVARDSLFTEALYQLGQLYLQQKNYAQAELYLNKACGTLVDSTKNARKAQILYELANTRKTLGQLEEAEISLREAKILARDHRLQVLLNFELATNLYQQNRYNDAFAEILTAMESREDSVHGEARKTRTAEMQSIYWRAQQYCANQELEKAVIAYDSLLHHTGGFEVVARALKAHADTAMVWPLSAAIKPRQSEERIVYISSVFAALILLPLLGFIVFSPSLRIAFYRWRKNHLAAAKTFEKLLERNPKKINFYAPLAELYLQLGRSDERALKVYKTVLQLKLHTPRRDEINALVAQKYLAEGRIDSEVIEVLENALKVERRKDTRALKAAN